jgi:hypothetical protein
VQRIFNHECPEARDSDHPKHNEIGVVVAADIQGRARYGVGERDETVKAGESEHVMAREDGEHEPKGSLDFVLGVEVAEAFQGRVGGGHFLGIRRAVSGDG